MTPGDAAIHRALALLADAARQEIGRQPRGHLLRSDGLELSLFLPLAEKSLGAAAEKTHDLLRTAVEAAIEEGAALRPGHVLDLRTNEAQAAPPDGRHVFVGYEPNGAPGFSPFHQWLLDMGHPEQEKIYRQPPGLVTVALDEEDIHGQVLPAFRPENPPVKICGQLVAGWFRVPHKDGAPGYVALTFQVLEIRGRPPRYVLEIIGRGPDGELEDAVVRLGEPPWRVATLWGQKALDSIRFQERGKTKKSERIQGILGGMARRLHQTHRGRERRTGHAEERHRTGSRPTRMAVADLEKALDEDILLDRRHDTYVVLGERGRAHVWSPQGKLVTSIRHTPESIERKKRAEIWRPASKDEVEGLRLAVGRRGN